MNAPRVPWMKRHRPAVGARRHGIKHFMIRVSSIPKLTGMSPFIIKSTKWGFEIQQLSFLPLRLLRVLRYVMFLFAEFAVYPSASIHLIFHKNYTAITNIHRIKHAKFKQKCHDTDKQHCKALSDVLIGRGLCSRFPERGKAKNENPRKVPKLYVEVRAMPNPNQSYFRHLLLRCALQI